MAKSAPTKKSEKKAPVTIITIADLVNETGIDPRKIRQIIRGLGLKAPPTECEGFGPKARYEWPSDSADLKDIRAALAGAPKAAPKTEKVEKTPKKAKKAEAVVEETEDDEDSDDEDDEDE